VAPTERVHRTVFVVGAAALELAALAPGEGVAEVVGRALAEGAARGPGHANGRRVAGVGLAALEGGALDVREGVGLEARRALADGLVIVGYADGVEAAGAPVADVVARVPLEVAELRRRAVDIVDAGHALAALGRVVGVAGVEARRALAIGHVVAHDAEGVGPAAEETAERLAAEDAVGPGPAGLLLRAVGVAQALVLPGALAAVAVVRIAAEARQALAARLVPARDALGVGRAGEALADREALEDAEGVGEAGRARGAVRVGDAVRHRGLLAARAHRVPLVAFEASAGRPGLGVELAALVSPAGDLGAGLDALAETGARRPAHVSGAAVGAVAAARVEDGPAGLAALDEIAGVAGEAVDAEAGGYVVLGDAEGVRTALELAAAVEALARALAHLEADLLGLAVKVVGAVAALLAAPARVARVAAIARRANAGPVLADGTGPALDVAALVHAFAGYASVIQGTGELLATGTGAGFFAGAHLHALAARKGIAVVTVFAAAVVAADGVNAHCVAAACVSITLVNVYNIGAIKQICVH
jgi:hypothetical protein